VGGRGDGCEGGAALEGGGKQPVVEIKALRELIRGCKATRAPITQ